MLRLGLTLLGAALLAPTLAGQNLFRATLDGTQEVPPTVTDAGAWANVTLDTTTGIVTYDLRTWGLSGTAAHLHNSAGGIEVTLSGGPTVWSGSSLPMSAGQIADMQTGTWYANVHTVANPGGEIRGALLPRPNVFGARLNAAQEVPSNGTTATGVASATLNADNTLTYSVTVSGMTGTAAHFHQAVFGSSIPGSIEVTLSGGPTTWSGTSLPLVPDQIEDLQNKRWYVNVHSAAFPGGQIRGQVVPSGIKYGPSSDPTTGVITLNVTGTPADYGGGFTGSFTVSITNGKPLGTGFMFTSFSPSAALFKTEPLVLNLAGANMFALPLNGSGAFSASAPTPGIPASFSLYLQYFGLNPAAPNGVFNASNGVEIPFSNF